MSNFCKEFVISENVKNISRFVDEEHYFTNTEERFNIPWRLRIGKNNGYFEFCFICEKDECENMKWSIETELALKLISCNGKSSTKTGKYTFEKPEANGWSKFISWKELENSPCLENDNQKIFLLHHTVENVSSIKEGGDYYTKTEKKFNIPWRLKIQRRNGFFGLYLRCEKELSNKKHWIIAVDYTLKLVSVNGQSLSFKEPQIAFNRPIGYGFAKFIRWDDMLEKYMVNDSVIIAALVKITETTGCEEE